MLPSSTRIVLIINDLRTGGAERVIAADASALAARGHAVTVALLYGSRADPFAQDLPPSVRLVELHAVSPYDWRAMRQFRTLVRAHEHPAVLSTLNDANLFARASLLGLRGVRYIRREANELSTKPWWHRVVDAVLDWRTDAVIALSEHMARDVRHSNPWLRFRVSVLPNAVELPTEAHHLASEMMRIIAIGSLTPKKDHATLIRACGLLARLGVRFSLTIIGEGGERARLAEIIKTENLGAVATLLGRIDHEAVLQELQRSSVFVLPSEIEGSPNALLEAMASGLPSVVSDIPSIRETADDGSALFAPVGDVSAFAAALGRLCDDVALRVSMGARARELVRERSDPTRHLERLEAILYGKAH